MDTPITIIVPIDAKPEFRDIVYKRLIELTAATRKEAGNAFYIPHEVSSDPNRFVIYECWKNQAALDFHMNQSYLTAFLHDCEAWLQKPIAGTICREIKL